MAGPLDPARLPQESVVPGSTLLQILEEWQLVLPAGRCQPAVLLAAGFSKGQPACCMATPMGTAQPRKVEALGRWKPRKVGPLSLPFLILSRHHVPSPGCEHTAAQPLPGVPDQVREGAVARKKWLVEKWSHREGGRGDRTVS